MPQPPALIVDQGSQRAVLDAEPRYRALFHNRTIAIARCRIIADEFGHPINYVIEEVNEAYERIVGIKKANIEGRLVTEVFPGIERFQFDFIGTLGRLGLHGGEMDCEVQLPGSGQWLSIHAYGSAKSECTAIFTDVTAQKKAEAILLRQQAQLQAIIDHSPVLISMKDTTGIVILANQALLDMVGAKSPDQFIGRSVFDLFPAEVAQQLWANDLAALESNAPRRAEEMVQDKNGDWRTYLTVKFPVRDSVTGEPYGVCAISTDITEQKRANAEQERLEQALQQSHQELEARVGQRTAELTEARLSAEKANKAKSDFLTIFSHEMRTPLNGMLGLTSLLSMGPLDESKRRHVELINQSGEALMHLLNDFLNFAKFEVEQLQLALTEFSPEEVSRQAMSMVQVLADRKGLRLQSSIQAPACVLGDAARLKQILLNLLNNAVKFTEHGSVTLHCAQISRQGPQVTLEFTVSDTGIGVDAKAQSTLFQPFVQADATITRRFGGTGLGLAICKRLAQVMGGQVGVRSTPGQGSSFWFELPFEVVADATLAPALLHDGPVKIRSGLARILIVDDNSTCQQVTSQMLEVLGLQFDVVRDGQEALDALRRQAYGLILMDCEMSVMDGFEATRRIRAEEASGHHHTVIVACTASVMNGDAQKCLAAGMDDFVSKPLKIGAIERIIGKWLS